MKTVQIFYFSGTGNTWWAAHMLAGCLRSAGVEAEVHSIECISAARADVLIGGADIVAFGYPIYGSDIPKPMKCFMTELSTVTSKNTLVFCTQWLWSGDGARVAEEFIAEKGFLIRWAEHLHMPNNLSVSLPIPIYTDEQNRKTKYLRHSEGRLKRLADRVAAGVSLRRGFSRISTLSGIIQRVPYRAMLEQHGDTMSVDHERCTMCGQCISLCPAMNLSVRDGQVCAGDGCVSCMRCYNFCPVSAFMFRGRPHRHRHGKPYRGPVPEFDPVRLSRGGCDMFDKKQ